MAKCAMYLSPLAVDAPLAWLFPFARQGFEEFDVVAGPVFQQDLLGADASDDLIAEPCPGAAQALDFARQVLDFQLDAVPAAG
jgi:hypothetical protein